MSGMFFETQCISRSAQTVNILRINISNSRDDGQYVAGMVNSQCGCRLQYDWDTQQQQQKQHH